MQLVPRPRRRRRNAPRTARGGRGVALIFVLTTIAILTAIAVDFAYNARVNLELAVQSRDALRARSLAMSAMNYSRLVLRFQRQLDQAGGAVGGGLQALMQGGGLGAQDTTQLMQLAQQAGVNEQQILAALSGQGGLGGAAGAAGAAASGPSIRLWEILPVDSNSLMALMAVAFPKDGPSWQRNPPSVGATDNGGEFVEADFGEFSGAFGAQITDEDQKINVQRLDALGGVPLATLIQMSELMADQRFDFIFNEEDANRDRVDRRDVISSIRDWIDIDETASSIDPSNPASPFVTGFGDENGPYSRYKRRYKAKNARFDTLEELHQVYGVNDAFMAAFGDRLTVYPDINSKLNVNTDDELALMTLIRSAAANPMDPLLNNPVTYQLVMQQLQLIKRFSFVGLSVPTFVAVLQSVGLEVRPELTTPNSPQSWLGDRSSTFRIEATGQAGRVTKKLTAIVRYDDGLGQLLYWHEE